MSEFHLMLKLPNQRVEAVLGQASAVLAGLDRQPGLPAALRLEIEEAIEAAWEIAYRREAPRAVLVDFRAARTLDGAD